MPATTLLSAKFPLASVVSPATGAYAPAFAVTATPASGRPLGPFTVPVMLAPVGPATVQSGVGPKLVTDITQSNVSPGARSTVAVWTAASVPTSPMVDCPTSAPAKWNAPSSPRWPNCV